MLFRSKNDKQKCLALSCLIPFYLFPCEILQTLGIPIDCFIPQQRVEVSHFLEAQGVAWARIFACWHSWNPQDCWESETGVFSFPWKSCIDYQRMGIWCIYIYIYMYDYKYIVNIYIYAVSRSLLTLWAHLAKIGMLGIERYGNQAFVLFYLFYRMYTNEYNEIRAV